MNTHDHKCGWNHYDDPAWRRCTCGYFYSIGQFEDGYPMEKWRKDVEKGEEE